MENVTWGVVTLAACAIACFFSWRYWIKGNAKAALFLLLFCGFALRMYASCSFFLHPWDERYHALVAKNMMEDPFTPVLYKDTPLKVDYTNWTANHIWLHKQPLALWTMAASMQLFGVNEIALRLPSVILTTIGIWLTFYIGSFLFDRRTGFLAAFFYAVNGRIIEQAAGRVATDHIDVFFLFFTELAVFFSICFAQKKKTIYTLLAGASIGAAVLSKWLPALIVIPVWLLLAIDSGAFTRKQLVFQLFLLCGSCVLVFLPWQLYIYHAFPLEARWEAGYNLRHMTEVLEGHGGTSYSFAGWMHINYGDLVTLPLLWFVWKLWKDRKNLKDLALFTWFIVPFVFFSFAQTKMMGYILFISPALFLITSAFWMMLLDYRENHRFRWFFNLVLLFMIVLPLRYTIERVKPFEKNEAAPQWVAELKKLGAEKINKGVLLNYDKPVEAMFYTGMSVYPELPSKEVISGLLEKGYTVLVNNSSNVPAEIRAMKKVRIENLSATGE